MFISQSHLCHPRDCLNLDLEQHNGALSNSVSNEQGSNERKLYYRGVLFHWMGLLAANYFRLFESGGLHHDNNG